MSDDFASHGQAAQGNDPERCLHCLRTRLPGGEPRMSATLLFTVLEADYHRNGVAGEGFYVGIVRDQDGRKLVTYFPEYDQAGEIVAHRTGRVAVVDIDLAAAGNVYMHETGTHAGGN